MVLHVCITKVTFCIFVVRVAVFELDAVPQTSSWRHVVGGRGHCCQQAFRVRDGCFVVKTYVSLANSRGTCTL